MLKIVVLDSGFGGELFADKLQENLDVVEIIRVIDWRNANGYLESRHKARQLAERALRPYLGRVDLIVFANTLLSITSLKYFERKYKTQKFIGLGLKMPDTFIKRDVLIISTSAVAKTINYHNFLFHLKRTSRTLIVDDWPNKIDDGELSTSEIKYTINQFLLNKNYYPKEIILACTQFSDIKLALKEVLGSNTKIYDSFDDGVHAVCKTLKLRGGLGNKRPTVKKS